MEIKSGLAYTIVGDFFRPNAVKNNIVIAITSFFTVCFFNVFVFFSSFSHLASYRLIFSHEIISRHHHSSDNMRMVEEGTDLHTVTETRTKTKFVQRMDYHGNTSSEIFYSFNYEKKVTSEEEESRNHCWHQLM